jgi:hypothetical protein
MIALLRLTVIAPWSARNALWLSRLAVHIAALPPVSAVGGRHNARFMLRAGPPFRDFGRRVSA